jgi:FAD/FMN-containing dehydrogenase
VLRPKNIQAVCDAVIRATATGRLIKVVGSGHSFTGIAVAPDIQLDLGALTGVIAVDRDRRQVTVGGGTPLWQLTRLLARHGLALENMGDIDRQTISGAISTGTHGTGLAFGGLATQVVGLTLVSGTGELVRIDEEQSSELLPAARAGRAGDHRRGDAAVRARLRDPRHRTCRAGRRSRRSLRRTLHAHRPFRVLLVPAH